MNANPTLTFAALAILAGICWLMAYGYELRPRRQRRDWDRHCGDSLALVAQPRPIGPEDTDWWSQRRLQS